MKTILDNKYEIEAFKGKGGYSEVFLVKDIKTHKEYAAKIITKYNLNLANELEICKIIKKQIKSPYIIEFIENGIGTIQKGEKIIENQEYYIFNYASNNNLWKYIYLGPFKEKYCKIIFEKILKGVKSLHDKGVCHLDINPNNILLDDNFTPKICDFGLATFINGEDGTGKLYNILGTSFFKPPQMYINSSYNGIKADIFSLGVTLFALMTNKPCFRAASKKDKYYKNLLENHKKYENYFKIKFNIEFNEIFLDLFYQMVAFEEEKRPKNIETILEHKWFNEINELSKDERMILEEQVRLEFEKRNTIINKSTQFELNINDSKRIFERTHKKTEYFSKDINPKLINDELKMDNYIKIKGNLNPNEFMNNLAYEINFLYDGLIEPSKKNLKFICIFKKKDNNYEIETDDDNILDFEYLNQIEKDCIIQIKLLKLKNEEYILRFRKQSGELYDYYQNLFNIFEKIEKLI